MSPRVVPVSFKGAVTNIDPAIVSALRAAIERHPIRMVGEDQHDAFESKYLADALAPLVADAVKAAETTALTERDALRAENARLRAAIEVAIEASRPRHAAAILHAALVGGGGR